MHANVALHSRGVVSDSIFYIHYITFIQAGPAVMKHNTTHLIWNQDLPVHVHLKVISWQQEHSLLTTFSRDDSRTRGEGSTSYIAKNYNEIIFWHSLCVGQLKWNEWLQFEWLPVFYYQWQVVTRVSMPPSSSTSFPNSPAILSHLSGPVGSRWEP